MLQEHAEFPGTRRPPGHGGGSRAASRRTAAALKGNALCKHDTTNEKAYPLVEEQNEALLECKSRGGAGEQPQALAEPAA